MGCVSGEWKNGEGDCVAYIRTEEKGRKLMSEFSPFLKFFLKRYFSKFFL